MLAAGSALSRADAWLTLHPWAARAAVFLAALLPRLLLLEASLSVPGLRTAAPGLDVALNTQAAAHLTRATPAPVFELMAQSAPLYPWLLALAHAAIGADPFGLRCATALLGAARFPLLYGACKESGARPSVAAAITCVAAWAPAPLYADTTLLKATLDLTLCTALIATTLCALRNARSKRARAVWGVCVGGLAALSALSQQNLWLIGLAPIAAVVFSAWPMRHKLQMAFGIALVLGATLGLWTARSQAPHSAWLGRGGFELYLGQRPEVTGYYTEVEGIPPYPFGHAFVARIALERAERRPLTPEAADRLYFERALSFWSEHTKDAVALSLRKVRLFFHAFEPRDTHYLAWVVAQVWWLPPASLGFALAALLGLLGLCFPGPTMPRAARALLLASVLAVLAANVATFVNFRFRLPAFVPLTIAGAVFATRLFDRSWRGTERAWAALTAAALGALLWAPEPPGMHQASLAKAEKNAALSRAAEADAAALAREASGSRTASLSRAALLLRLQRYTEAHAELGALYAAGQRPAWLVQARARTLLWASELDHVRRLLAETPGAFDRPEGDLTRVEFERLLQLRAEAR